jgi:hypothetical protein
VERNRDPHDRRGVLVAATPRVFATLGPLYAGCAEALRATVAAYPVEEQHAAVRHLQDAAEVWERSSGPG